MSILQRECPVSPTWDTLIKIKSECTWAESWIPASTLPDWPDNDVIKIVTDSQLIKELKDKDSQLQKEIDEILEDIWPGSDILKRLTDLEACCEESKETDDSTSSQINEINANITLLKGRNVRQDKIIESFQRNIIMDDTYLNFQDWLENVYLPNIDSLSNKYKAWDIYINVNQDVAATNATYIFIRYPDSEEEPGAIDWQELYYSSPADVLTILGIDPVEVEHPFKHERVIKVNEDKLRDMIESLPRLDLSSVELNLWVIYEKPVYKNDVTIEFNLTVEWDTHLNNVYIDNHTETKTLKTENLNVTNITNSPVFNNSVTVNENITAWDTITTNKFYSTGHSYFNETTFTWPMYILPWPGNPGQAPASIDQAIFTASFARFSLCSANQHTTWAPMERSWQPWVDLNRTRLIQLWWWWLWDKSVIWLDIRWQKVADWLWVWNKESRWTEDILIMPSWLIRINNTWIYEISFLYNMWQSWNVYANRAWFLTVRYKDDWTYEFWDFIDAKYNSWIENNWKTPNTYIYRWHNTSNDHVYSTWDYTSLDRVDRINEEYAIATMLWQELSAIPFQWSALVQIPYWQIFGIIPYIKPSCAWWDRQPWKENMEETRIRANEWWWDTGAACTINIHKVANSTTNNLRP